MPHGDLQLFGLDIEPRIRDQPGARPLQIAGGEVRFAEVRFGYQPGSVALDGISLGMGAFSDEHGTDLQRHYNLLCLGYGGPNSAMFQDFVDQGALPKERAGNCAHEYQQVRNAFRRTVLPFVDVELMKKVQATEWLRPDDFK